MHAQHTHTHPLSHARTSTHTRTRTYTNRMPRNHKACDQNLLVNYLTHTVTCHSTMLVNTHSDMSQ